MIKITYKTINTEFHFPFTISKGTKTHQPALIVSLSYMGKTGYGEAPAIVYYNISVPDMIEKLELKKTLIEQFKFTSPDRFWHFCHHLFPSNHFLVCALDIAFWDLYGKVYNKPIYELLKQNKPQNIITDYTIGIADEATMIKKMTEKPWPIYKIKCGFDGDIEIIAALRKHTIAPFRVDANTGWPDANIALEKIKALKDLGVELVEQPLPKDDWEGMKILFEKSTLPLMADETCVTEHDVVKCVNHFHGINIKLTKCGGITPAIRMIENARKLNLKIMMGCMNETNIGSAAMAHCSTLLDYLDMDGPLLLKADTTSGLTYNMDGSFNINSKSGLGIEVQF